VLLKDRLARVGAWARCAILPWKVSLRQRAAGLLLRGGRRIGSGKRVFVRSRTSDADGNVFVVLKRSSRILVTTGNRQEQGRCCPGHGNMGAKKRDLELELPTLPSYFRSPFYY
jgi:hypothetical protein